MLQKDMLFLVIQDNWEQINMILFSITPAFRQQLLRLRKLVDENSLKSTVFKKSIAYEQFFSR